MASVGGGTIREIMLGRIPFYFQDYTYIFVILIAALVSIGLYHYFHAIKQHILVLDAIGMVTFAFIGARAADTAHLGIIGVVFCAGLTAWGGGILCDLVARQTPRAFRHNLYAVPSILLGTTYSLLGEVMYRPVAIIMLTGIIFAMQVAVINPGRYGHKIKRYVSRMLAVPIRRSSARQNL